MPQRSWPGSLITKTPVTPAGPYQEGAASGVWTLEEALQWTGKDLWPLGGNTFTPLIFIGGFSTSNTTKIQQVNPASTGDAENWADLSAAVYYSAGCGNSTRAVWSPMTGDTNRIEYIDYATGGTSSTFGDVVQSDSEECAALSNSTRACFASGAATAAEDVICYITISSTGNATDFGDLTIARDKLVGMASATRGLFVVEKPAATLQLVSIILQSQVRAMLLISVEEFIHILLWEEQTVQQRFMAAVVITVIVVP